MGLNGLQRQPSKTCKRKPKATYVFASSLVAYVTLTTAVSVSVLTRREGKITLSQEKKAATLWLNVDRLTLEKKAQKNSLP